MALNGLLVVISAPSGCGKTTIVDRLLKRHPDWARSVSATTRSLRSGEREDLDYYFLSQQKFKEMKAKGDFLEFAAVHDNFYGTPKAPVIENLEQDKIVILAIDVQGMKKVRESLGDKASLISIFVLPPSLKVLRERLEGRKTDKAEEIEKRLRIAEEEIKEANLYDFTVINQNLEQAVNEVDEIILNSHKERG